jgi:hypothetical protein
MKKPIWKYIRILLDIAGAVALVVLVTLFTLNFRQFSGLFDDQQPKVDQLSPKDAKFVLNWGSIGDKAKIERIIHSYESPRSLTGDHVDAYCIKIDIFPDSVLRQEKGLPQEWSQGPVTDRVLKEAVELSCSAAESDGQKWFPKASELNSDRYYLSFWQIVLHNQFPTAVQLIAYDRKEKLLYYLSFKT